jgi:hypothetical protein
MNHDAHNSTKCKACGKDIKFIETKNGKQMPVDAEMQIAKEPKDKGTFFMINGKTQTGIKAGECYYVPHWSTCTDPGKFKKTKGEQS